MKTITFEIKDAETGDKVGISNCLPSASAIYDLADKSQRPIAVFVRDLKLFDTRTIEMMKTA